MRWALGGSASQPLRHLGEATTIVVAARSDHIAVIDERDARRIATGFNVPVVGSVGVLRALVTDDVVTAVSAWEILERMRALGVRVPPAISLDYFD